MHIDCVWVFSSVFFSWCCCCVFVVFCFFLFFFIVHSWLWLLGFCAWLSLFFCPWVFPPQYILHAHAHAHIHIHTTHTHAYTYTYTCVCACACACACVCVCVCVSTCINQHIFEFSIFLELFCLLYPLPLALHCLGYKEGVIHGAEFDRFSVNIGRLLAMYLWYWKLFLSSTLLGPSHTLTARNFSFTKNDLGSTARIFAFFILFTDNKYILQIVRTLCSCVH